MREPRQLTRGAGGRILTNTAVWSPNSRWIVYDTRPDAAGEKFEGRRIEMVNVESGEVRLLYEAQRGACCGVATFHPRDWRVVFIRGPENPTPDWPYSASHREGVMVDVDRPGVARHLDARDLVPPFTPGALRGGSHVHVWDAAGEWLSFTYNDALVESAVRDVAVSIPGHGVRVKKDHPRNHDGEMFSVVISSTTADPAPGSDEIKRACEEGWIGAQGYVRVDGLRQRRAIAFQGHVMIGSGETIAEVFVVDLPDDLIERVTPENPGSLTARPTPPAGVRQRRLTFTANRQFPGLQGARHWLRSSPDGSRIACLMKDERGIVQLWTVSPNGGSPVQMTNNDHDVASAFSWSPDGTQIAHLMDGSVCVTNVNGGETVRLTRPGADSLRPEACVFSPDGKRIAFVRRVRWNGREDNQICVAELE